MSDDLGSIHGAIELDVGQLRQALQQIGSMMASIEQAITKTGAITDRAGAQMTDAMRETATGMQQAKQAMQATSQAAGPLSSRLGEAGKALADAGKAADRAVDGLRKTTTAAKDARESFQQMGENLTKTGGALSLGITAPIALLGKTALDAAGDYQVAMSLFQANTQATNAQMQQFGERAKALGADLQLPGASAGDAANVMLELAKAGLSTQAAMDQARGTMALAATEMIDNAEAATIAAGAYNTFKAEGLQVSQIADMLAAGSSASSASVLSLSQGLQQAGSSFAAAHIPMRDLVAQMSLMANAGIQGSDAGTSLKTMLQRLQGPTGDARAAMQQLGISIYDQAGAMRPMRDLVEQFSTKLAGLTQEERDRAIITIFGADAQRAANIVLAGGVEQYDKMTVAVGRQGAASDLAAARMTGITGAMDGFQSALETALLTGIEPFLGGITTLINAASGVVNAFAELDPSLRNGIVAFAAVAAATGPVLLAVGALTTALATVSLPLIGAAAGIAAFAGALATGNPYIIGAASAIGAWALVQQIKALPALLTSIPAIVAQTQALIANAAATLAASGPFVVLGAAIAGALAIYQKWQNVSNEAAQKWLRQNETYQNATQALNRYNEASSATQAKVADQAAELQRLQEAQERDIQKRAEMAAQGAKDAKAWEENTNAINARTDKMKALTAEMNGLMDAEAAATSMTEEQTQAQQMSARAMAEAAAATKFAAGDILGALSDLQASAGLTEEEMKALGKALTKAAEDGAKAFGQAVGAEVGFLGEREAAQQSHGDKIKAIQQDRNDALTKLNADHGDKMKALADDLNNAATAKQRAAIQQRIAEEKKSYEDRKNDLNQANQDKLVAEDAAFKAQELQAAEAYAREQAAQLAHLGKMLMDYATAQGRMAGLSEAQIQQMTSKLAAQYGVQVSLTDRSFGQMTGSIDAWVASGGRNTDAYIANMQRIQAETVTTQQQVDAKIKDMTAQAKADFDAGKLTVEEYAQKLTRIPAEAQKAVDALNGIPTSINSTVTVTTIRKEVGGQGVGDASAGRSSTGAALSGTRALGGPVRPRSLYEVSEGGIPELLSVAGRTYLMMGQQAGQVFPAMRTAQAALAGQGAAVRQAVGRSDEDPAGDAYNRLYADPRFRDTIKRAGSDGLLAFRRLWATGDYKGGDFGVQEDDPLITEILRTRTQTRSNTTAASALRQAMTVAPANKLIAAQPSTPSGKSINLTVAPVFNGLTVDTAERVQQITDQIIAKARTLITGDLDRAVTGLINAGGAR